MSQSDLDTASTAEVKPLLRRLKRLGDRWPSEPTLAHLSPRMRNGLLAYIALQEREGPRCRVVSGIVCAAAFWLWALEPGTSLLIVAVLPLLLAGMCGYFPAREYRNTVLALTQTDDVRVLPALIKATAHIGGRHPEVVNAIRRLLYLVTEEHIGLLSSEVQLKLWYFAAPGLTLETRGEEGLGREAVRALAYVGNRDMLDWIRRYAYNLGASTAQRSTGAFMEPYIALMEARLQRLEVPQTLLRASDVSDTQPDTLLRAARPATNEPTAQLLRPSTSEHADTST